MIGMLLQGKYFIKHFKIFNDRVKKFSHLL